MATECRAGFPPCTAISAKLFSSTLLSLVSFFGVLRIKYYTEKHPNDTDNLKLWKQKQWWWMRESSFALSSSGLMSSLLIECQFQGLYPPDVHLTNNSVIMFTFHFTQQHSMHVCKNRVTHLLWFIYITLSCFLSAVTSTYVNFAQHSRSQKQTATLFNALDKPQISNLI